jgi:hypothetical protein
MNLPVLTYRRFCTRAYSSSLLLMGKDPQDNSYITSAMRSGYRSLGRVSGHRQQPAHLLSFGVAAEISHERPLCVQRRLVRPVGDSPTGVRVGARSLGRRVAVGKPGL